MSKKDIHVVPRGSEWVRVKEGSSRGSVHSTQKEAVAKARDAAKRDGVSVVVHGRNGRIRETETYGRDPFPPRDTIKPAPRHGTVPLDKIRRAVEKAKR